MGCPAQQVQQREQFGLEWQRKDREEAASGGEG
jgi:hypothetical protein